MIDRQMNFEQNGVATANGKALSKETLLRLYRTMRVIRLTEEELARSHQQGLIHGACHTYVGQEAIATGVCDHLAAEDPVFSTHRGHGHALAKGMDPESLIAELFGRMTGCSRGRGGSMHLFSPEIGMMGTSGIVGPCILQACGGGYSSKLLQTGTVSVAFFGDGASNNGAFHEGLNMASIWRLPVLFICENNQYATEVPFSYASGSVTVAERASAYGIPGVEVDGNDVSQVYQAAAEAISRARRGLGPTLIECRTYRTRAHAEGIGDFTYRTREEVEKWKTRCPLQVCRSQLMTEFDVDPEELDQIDTEVVEQVSQARQRAQLAPVPDASESSTHIYAVPRQINAPAPGGAEKKMSFIQATLDALSIAMTEDSRIFVMGEGIGKRGGNFKTTDGLFDRFGQARLCDTPICERGFVGLACGAAMTGSRPVIDFMFADFLLDSVGEVVNQIAKMQYMSSGRLQMPVVLRGCIGIGHSAATHHSGSYYGMYAQVPGLKVVVPSNARDAKGLFLHALRGNDPVLFLEHREILQAKCLVPEGDFELEFGRAEVVRQGRDITVVALARMLQLTLSVCDELEREGISVELIDPRTVQPLDVETILASVSKTGRLLIVDEPPASCGFAAEIAARISDTGFNDLDAPIRRLTGSFTPTPYSPVLEATVIPNAKDILHAIRSLIQE